MIKFTRHDGERVVTDDYAVLRDAVKNGDVQPDGFVEVNGFVGKATYHTVRANPSTLTIIVREPQIMVIDLKDVKK